MLSIETHTATPWPDTLDWDARAAEARIPALLGAASGFGGMRPVRPSLEDVFVSLVRREGGALEG